MILAYSSVYLCAYMYIYIYKHTLHFCNYMQIYRYMSVCVCISKHVYVQYIVDGHPSRFMRIKSFWDLADDSSDVLCNIVNGWKKSVETLRKHGWKPPKWDRPSINWCRIYSSRVQLGCKWATMWGLTKVKRSFCGRSINLIKTTTSAMGTQG